MMPGMAHTCNDLLDFEVPEHMARRSVLSSIAHQAELGSTRKLAEVAKDAAAGCYGECSPITATQCPSGAVAAAL